MEEVTNATKSRKSKRGRWEGCIEGVIPTSRTSKRRQKNTEQQQHTHTHIQSPDSSDHTRPTPPYRHEGHGNSSVTFSALNDFIRLVNHMANVQDNQGDQHLQQDDRQDTQDHQEAQQDTEVNINDLNEPDDHNDFNNDMEGFGARYSFPFPGQRGAPYSDGRNVSKFLTNWEDLTIGWASTIKVKKIPLYCEDLLG